MKTSHNRLPTVGLGMVIVIFALSCAGTPAGGGTVAGDAGSGAAEKPAARGALIRTDPEATPEWVHNVPKSSTELFFVGLSKNSPSAAAGRESARDDAMRQVARYYGEFLQSNLAIRSRYAQNNDVTLSDLTELDEDITSFAQAVVTQLSADRYFTEVSRGLDGGEVFVVYALCQIPRQKAEADIRDFARTISERYGNLIAKPDSLMTALSGYNHVLQALEKNPLHRSVAAYTTRNGQVNLYDYLITEMNALAAAVTFSPVSSSIKQSDVAFEMTLRVNSATYPNIGPLDMEVRLENGGHSWSSLIAPDNTAAVRINTEALQRGKYAALFEIPLKDMYPVIRSNPQGSYTFEIKTISASLAFEGSAVTARERAAFREAVQQGIQRFDAPVRLVSESNTPSGGGEYVIMVNYNYSVKKAAPPIPVDMHYCVVSLALFRNGAMLRQSDLADFSEISAARLFGMASAAVRDNRGFFAGLAGALAR